MEKQTGKELPRAKPIVMTFYDALQTIPYTSTFYVSDDASEEDCQRLIAAVADVSLCVLGKYRIGYKQYVIPEYHKAFATIKPMAMGTHKWLIRYRTKSGAARSHTIPGWDPEMTRGIKATRFPSTVDSRYTPTGRLTKVPDITLPEWQRLLAVFTELCVSQEGEPIEGQIELGRTASNWPPKSARKRK